MNPSKSDDSVKAGADLLLKGWKMLNKACPSCVEPLYEKEGKVVCVKCKKQYVMVDSKTELPKNQEKDFSKEKPNSISQKAPLSVDISSLPPELAESAKIMLEKISILNERLKSETNPKEITELSKSIKSLTESLRSLTS
ncbi:MAG: Sjogren's syndrome/scleroderma autoantigen 1 family protein [Candidatus Thorarchaeota archaeon]